MKYSKALPSLLALLLVAGCSGSSENRDEDEVVSVAVVDNGPVTPDPISTKAVIKAESIEYSRTVSGQVVEKWVRKVQPADFSALNSRISQYNIFNAPDVTLQPGQSACAGWQGMTIVMEKTDSTHVLNIDGSVCDRSQWPEGIRALVGLHDALVDSYPCPLFSPPAPDWCADGTVLPPVADEHGCYGPPRCQPILCPEIAPHAPEWCADGTFIPPQIDENGCYGAPTCRLNQ